MKGSSSSGYAGSIGTVPKAIGLLLSGFAISKWKLSARFLSGWSVVLGTMFFIALCVFSSLGCPSSTVPDADFKSCNLDCKCPASSRLNPICAQDGKTNYYSPCLAGCTESKFDKNTKTKYYYNCTCIAAEWNEKGMELSEKWLKKVR